MHAVATLSEFLTPRIGSATTASASSSTWVSTPMRSFPSTSASGEGIGCAVYSRLRAVVSAAHTYIENKAHQGSARMAPRRLHQRERTQENAQGGT